MLEYRYDTQLLIEGKDLDEDTVSEYFTNNFKGDCLLAGGDDELIKIHFHTNEPWKVLDILDISQTIVQGYFNMMMIVDTGGMEKQFGDMADELVVLGEEIGVVIKCQKEEIFDKMHRI